MVTVPRPLHRLIDGFRQNTTEIRLPRGVDCIEVVLGDDVFGIFQIIGRSGDARGGIGTRPLAEICDQIRHHGEDRAEKLCAGGDHGGVAQRTHKRAAFRRFGRGVGHADVGENVREDFLVDIVKRIKQASVFGFYACFHTVIPSFPSSSASFFLVLWSDILTRLSPNPVCCVISRISSPAQ